jgi:5-methylcytosine-specific restriction protein A
MKTYLFVWNPKRWTWGGIEDDVKQVDLNGVCSLRWSTGNSKLIQPGDRVFLIKVGTEPKGLIGAGFAKTSAFLDKHWSGENRMTNYVKADFETLMNPDKDLILALDVLNTGKLSKQNWTPQSSGISIRPELADELEGIWFDFLTTNKIRHNPFVPNSDKSEKTYAEGTPSQVLMTKYERNPFARKVCIDRYGLSCSVCGFNFEKTYGEIGKDFIHVHHINQLAKIGRKYAIDPVRDLRPVCPNCHSMIHRTKTSLSITDLKKRVK